MASQETKYAEALASHLSSKEIKKILKAAGIENRVSKDFLGKLLVQVDEKDVVAASKLLPGIDVARDIDQSLFPGDPQWRQKVKELTKRG